MTITDRFRRIYRIYPIFNKGNPEDVNMEPVGLANTMISTDYALKFRQTLINTPILFPKGSQ